MTRLAWSLRGARTDLPLGVASLVGSARSGHYALVAERVLSEVEAFRAARYFIEQFNEREKSEGLELWIGWMDGDIGASDPRETADPAQWHDWVASVDRVIAERGA